MENTKTTSDSLNIQPDIPYIAHESSMARMERVTKRLWVIILVLIGLLLVTNAAWLWYESQFIDEYTTVEQEVDTGEGDAFVTGVGDVIYGENKTDG